MTQEEKAKAYDEAIEKAKAWCDCEHATTDDKILLKRIFPELNESEDERIRKELIIFVKSRGEFKQEYIAWLEKQGEQKRLDFPYVTGWRENRLDNKPQIKHSVLMLTTHGVAEGEWLGEEWCQYRWSCKVKDADVLYWLHLSDLESLEKENFEQKPIDANEEDNDFTIYHPIKNECSNKYEFFPYSFYGSIEAFHNNEELLYFLRNCFYKKEDCEKWCREQNEQKPAWSEEDEIMIRDITIDIEELIEQNAYDVTQLRKEIDWLKYLKDRVQPQKQEWSEEDEALWAEISDLLWEGYKQSGSKFSWDNIRNWINPKLKSLRPQNRWKPSDLPHWKKSPLPNDNTTGFNSDYFCYKGYNINYKELFEKLPKDD